MQHLTTRDLAGLVGVDTSMVRRRRKRGETNEDILLHYVRNHGLTSLLVQTPLATALTSLGRWFHGGKMSFPLVGDLLASAFMVDSDTDRRYNENNPANVGEELGRRFGVSGAMVGDIVRGNKWK